MRGVDKLSDKSIKSALRKAADVGKPVAINDGGGLTLEAQPSGIGWWRLRYWQGGKANRLSLGTYPDVPLRLARERRDEARSTKAAGIDPSQKRKDDKAAQASRAEAARLAAAGLPGLGTFEHAAREWHGRMKPHWSEGHAIKVLALLENDLFPYVGSRQMDGLTPPELLAVGRRVEARGAVETAYRVLKAAGAVFRHGVQSGYCQSDPTRDLKGAIVLPVAQHRAAITDPSKFGELLRAIDGYQGTPVVRAALALAPLVFVRPGELRKAEWSEFDLDQATWSIPSARMKGRLAAKLTGPPHEVSLAAQAVRVLRDLQPLTGRGRFVFPSPRSRERPMSDNAVLSALRRMGFDKDEMSGHGFRAAARTMAVERLKIDPDYVEAQLAHTTKAAHGKAYDRTKFLADRRELMQQWADYLDRLRQGGQIIEYKAG